MKVEAQYLISIVLRPLVAVYLTSYPWPDEYWQAPEVAHREVFGYGHLTWEWMAENPIRSPVYHTIFSLFYWVLKITGLDTDFLVAYGPRLVQCVFAFIYDIYIVKLLTLQGITNKRNIIILNFTSWYSLFVLSRTLINSFECVLFTLALYHWQMYLKSHDNKYQLICRTIVGISFAARCSSIIPWVLIWVSNCCKLQPLHLLTAKVEEASYWFQTKVKIFLINLATITIYSMVTILIDSVYYEKLTWTTVNFLHFNVIEGKSSFYGVQPGYQCLIYIIVQYLGWIPFMLFGIYFQFNKQFNRQIIRENLLTALFFIFVISLPAHKEDRFLITLIPVFSFWICLGLQYFDSQKKNRKLANTKSILLAFAVFSNLIFFAIMSTHSSVGGLETIDELRKQPNLKSVEFITNCHFTPYYQYLHRDIYMNFPDCSPYHEEGKAPIHLLRENATEYLAQVLEKHQGGPSHIIIYDYYYESTKHILQQYDVVSEVPFVHGFPNQDAQEKKLMILAHR